VISIDSEPEDAPRMPPTPQDAVFSNIIPARTSEADDLAQALANMGFIVPEQTQALAEPESPPYYQPAPSYETVEDPVTLASYLFKYGFGEFLVCSFRGYQVLTFFLSFFGSVPALLACRGVYNYL
jgi:hypothetical protein